MKAVALSKYKYKGYINVMDFFKAIRRKSKESLRCVIIYFGILILDQSVNVLVFGE